MNAITTGPYKMSLFYPTTICCRFLSACDVVLMWHTQLKAHMHDKAVTGNNIRQL